MIKKIPFLVDFLATGFFSGKIPLMSGTFGSLVAVVIFYFTMAFPLYINFIIFFILFFCGVFVSDKYSTISNIKDPSQVVIDEIAAMYLVLMLLPKGYDFFLSIILPFILFRTFDILKPFPVNYLEKISGGWGIMLDDIMAAIYAMICCYIIFHFVDKLS